MWRLWFIEDQPRQRESMATWNCSESQQASPSSGTLCHASLQVKFGLPLHETLHNNRLPCQLVEMLAYIAHEGVTTTDIFRRPGSTADLAVILADLTAGRVVNFTDYNFYTLASLTKKFLLKIPGGLFGSEVEDRLLEVLNLSSRLQKYEAINRILTELPLATQQLVSLLLGTWFRIVNHSEYNTMSSDAVAKSVAHCLFHSIATDPCRLQRAIQLLQILIDDFSIVNMLGARNIKYFSDVTRTRVSVQEKRHSQTRASTLCLTSENQCCNQTCNRNRSRATPRSSLPQPDTVVEICPPTPSPPLVQCPMSASCHNAEAAVSHWSQPWLSQHTSLSAPDVNKASTSRSHDSLSAGSIYISSSLSRFDNVKRRQMLRMKRRSHWFLSPNTSYQLGLNTYVTTSLSWPTTDGDSVRAADEHHPEARAFNITMPSNGLSLLPDAGLTSSASQQRFLVPHLEVTSPYDDEYQPFKSHLSTANPSSSSGLHPALFAQVPGSSKSNTVVG